MPDSTTLLKDTGVIVAADDVIDDILPFCAQGQVGRDLLSQADYAADMQRKIGHQPGLARAMLANKHARQVAHMAAGLAQFLARRYPPGVVDDGDLDKIEAALVSAVMSLRPQSDAPYALCTSEGATSVKAVTLDAFDLVAGAKLYLAFSEVNTAQNMRLSVNSGEAKPILVDGVAPEVGDLAKGQIYHMVYSGTSWQILAGMSRDRICQTAWFEDTLTRPGYAPMNGGVIADFAATWPQAMAYLATTHGQARLFESLEARTAAHVATWHTLASGQTVGWEGFGGLTKLFYDETEDKLYLPDVRGMIRSMAGDGIVAASMGESAGDRGRGAEGYVKNLHSYSDVWESSQYGGALSATRIDGTNTNTIAGSADSILTVALKTSKVVPTGATFAPRSWGALASCYLGQSAA